AFYARHVWPRRQRLGNLPSAFHQDDINDIERLMLDMAVAQPFQDWPLSCPGLFPQSLINEAGFFALSWQIGCRPQVCPVSEHDKKFSLLSVGGVLDPPWGDLV